VALVVDLPTLIGQMDRLIMDRGLWERMSAAGPGYVLGRSTWGHVVDRLVSVMSAPDPCVFAEPR
jgi:hypothetical protein